MSLYRFGQTAIGSTNAHNEPVITILGGHGKVAPDAVSATTQRVHAPLRITVQGDLIDIQSQSTLAYSYDHPKELIQRSKIITETHMSGCYQPLPREHAVSHPISTVQLPPFIYLYALHQLKQISSHTAHKNTAPQFFALFGGRQSPTFILNDLWICSFELNLWIQILPMDIVITGLYSPPTTQPLLLSIPSQSSQFTHCLVIGRDIYSVFLQPTQLELPKIKIESQLTIDDVMALLPTLIPPSPPQSLLEYALQLSSIDKNQCFTCSSTIASQFDQSLPLPRYKTASAAIGSFLFIHGGRSGYAQNYAKPTSCYSFDTNAIMEDDAFNIEAILPLTAKTTPQLDDSTQLSCISQSPQSPQSSPQSPQSSQNQTNNEVQPTFVSLILNDLWTINFNTFPYQWTRIDHHFSQADQILPSHRFAHAAQIITITSPLDSGSHHQQHHLVLSGGLRLNNICNNNDQNSTSSSYHKALIASPTLFFLDITPCISSSSKSSFQTAHFTPTLLLDKPHHTDKSDQIILPPFIQTGQRPYDIYGHQIVSLYYPTHLTLLSIGGTSHTCLAAQSVMSLDIPLSSNLYSSQSHLSSTQQTLYWTPIIAPIDDALLIRHTATILNPAQHLTQFDQQKINTQPTQIALLGGGALCFSFGSYYCPSMILSVTHCPTSPSSTTQAYSPFTHLTSIINTPSLHCLTPLPLSMSQTIISKQKQQQTFRDNHTTIDVSKNIIGVPQSCAICSLQFESKNKLFKHITITGHKKSERTPQ